MKKIMIRNKSMREKSSKNKRKKGKGSNNMRRMQKTKCRGLDRERMYRRG